MALLIVYESPKYDSITLNIPFSDDMLDHLHQKGMEKKIESVLADGDELDLIRNRFDNLPIRKGGICYWAGDLANFICANLTN